LFGRQLTENLTVGKRNFSNQWFAKTFVYVYIFHRISLCTQVISGTWLFWKECERNQPPKMFNSSNLRYQMAEFQKKTMFGVRLQVLGAI